MPTQNESTRPEPESEKVQVANAHGTTAMSFDQHEQAVLRGLIRIDAKRAVKLAEDLSDRDFYGPHNLIVYHAVVTAAHRMVQAGEGNTHVEPKRVELDLQRAGDLANPAVSHALLEATAGPYNPPVWNDLLELAAGLREARARRAYETPLANPS